MKAVVWKDIDTLEMNENYRDPVLKDDWVVIKVMSAGYCATDLEILRGAFGNPPSVIGHEICGIISEVGKNAKGCKVGDRVVVETAVSCGYCKHCQSGNKHLCNDCTEVGFPGIDGGYAQYVTCPDNCVHKIPDNMSYDEGGILEACLCPFGLIYRNGMRLDETVFIWGAGVAGLSFLQSVKLYNPRKVIVAVRRKEAAEIAYKFGADVVINAKEENLYERLLEETNGEGPTLSIDSAGAKQTIEDCVKVTAKGGRVILYGLPGDAEVTFPVKEIILNQLTVIGGTNNQQAWDPLIQYVSSGRFNVKDMITEKFSIDEYEKGIELLRHKSPYFIKAVLHPWDE